MGDCLFFLRADPKLWYFLKIILITHFLESLKEPSKFYENSKRSDGLCLHLECPKSGELWGCQAEGNKGFATGIMFIFVLPSLKNKNLCINMFI
jgi:hypothetical protein